MTQDTEDVVARMTRFAETLSVNRHYMTGQTCMEVQNDLRALLADRQSLSDRIDVLRDLLTEISEDSGFWAVGNEELNERVRAALHQEGIATTVGR